MSIHMGAGGVVRTAKGLHVGSGGVVRKAKSGWAGIGGVARKFLNSLEYTAWTPDQDCDVSKCSVTETASGIVINKPESANAYQYGIVVDAGQFGLDCFTNQAITISYTRESDVGSAWSYGWVAPYNDDLSKRHTPYTFAKLASELDSGYTKTITLSASGTTYTKLFIGIYETIYASTTITIHSLSVDGVEIL